MDREGGHVDLETFFVHHYHALVRGLAAVLGDWDLAEDAVQEAVLRALERRSGDLGKVQDLRAWVFRVARNVGIGWFRSWIGRLASGWGDERGGEPQELTHAVEEQVENNALAADVAAALRELPAHHREVLYLRYYEELSISDLAKILRLPANTVKVRVHRARAALRKRLLERWSGLRA